MAFLKVVKSKFLEGDERSIKAKINILKLFWLKGYSLVISLALIPLTLKLLDEYQYGVWITLFNVLSWISIFDIGIGNGLRNKYAEAIAKNSFIEAREYVSTAYFLTFGISVALIFIFIIPWILVDWALVFNVPNELSNDIFFLIGIAFLLTSFQFSLKLIGTLLTASHKPSSSALLNSISNTFVLIILWFGKELFVDSLFAIGLIYVGVPLLVFCFASIYFFNKQLKIVSPSFSHFKRNKVNSLFSLGVQFFIIQIAVVVIFSTDSMIITHTLSPKEVTPYNIVFRYFGVVTMVVGIFMTPFWSAYTEAAAKNDFIWIKVILNKQLKGMILVIIVILILLFTAQFLIPIWTQQNISLSKTLLIGMALYTLISVWNNIFSTLLNGLSITKVQTYTSILGTIINIPLSIFFSKSFGSGGVIFATIISLSFFAIFGSRQALLTIKRNT